MPKKNPPNLVRIEESLDGVMIQALNETSPGLGTKLHRILSALGQAHTAQTGARGPIGIQKQIKLDNKGRVDPAIRLLGNRLSGGAPAEEEDDFVIFSQLRSMLDCEALAKTLEGCADDTGFGQQQPEDGIPGEPGAPGTGTCSTLEFGESHSVDTGLTACYAVQAFNEYVYICGVDGSDPTLNIYRVKANLTLEFLANLVLSQEIRQMVLHGHYLFGCRDGAGSQLVLALDVANPWAPTETDSLDVGFAAQGLYADGVWLFVVGETDVASVDITNPAALRKAN
jgi:hypothetical protein